MSEVFLIVILPLWTVTLSLKFKTIFASLATLDALSAGTDELKVGNTFVFKSKATVRVYSPTRFILLSSTNIFVPSLLKDKPAGVGWSSPISAVL